MAGLKIDPDFQDLLPDDGSFADLEKRILADKTIHHPIVTWKDTIIDGHRRYRIASLHGLNYKVKCRNFKNKSAAMIWVYENQKSRRNLDKKQLKTLQAKLYKAEKEKPSDPTKTAAETVAEKTDSSPATVERAARVVKALKSVDPQIVADYESGEIKLSDADVVLLSKMDHDAQADLVDYFESGDFKSVKLALKHRTNTGGDELEDDEEYEEVEVEDLMKENATAIRSWATRVQNMVKELPETPWINHDMVRGYLRSAADSARTAIGKGVCPKCEGDGCKKCRQTGWLPKLEMDQLM